MKTGIYVINLISDFSLTQWKEDRSISIFGTLDHVEEIELMTDLGVYPYMMETECAVINSNISQGITK
jgi:hypothetical protein